MKCILDGARGQPVKITYPSARIMQVLTAGGMGALPGDAVTADLAEDPDKRLEVSTAMPKQRAIDNMVRSGHAPDFAVEWIDALLVGGQTGATALDMVRLKTYIGRGDQIAVNFEDQVAEWNVKYRIFRDAWRMADGGIVVDLTAAKTILAKRIIIKKRDALAALEARNDLALLTGQDEPLEAQYEGLVNLNLRKLGEKIMAAQGVDELLAAKAEALK